MLTSLERHNVMGFNNEAVCLLFSLCFGYILLKFHALLSSGSTKIFRFAHLKSLEICHVIFDA